MSARKIAVLCWVLLPILAGPFERAAAQAIAPPSPLPPEMRSPLAPYQLSANEPPLPGKNSVSGVKITQKSGIWLADFDYFYTGDPYSAALDVRLEAQSGSPLGSQGMEQYETYLPQPQRGAHHTSVEIRYPGNQLRTLVVEVTMRKEMFSKEILASQHVDQVIDWPDFQTWLRDQLLAKTPVQDNFDRAVSLIDSQGDGQLTEARTILEKLIAKDPKFSSAYVELARIAILSKGEPEGLHQAEGLLGSALQIEPDNVNAKILLGYVYAHQRKFEKAEALFTESSRTDTKNLWLWSNWGEMLQMEGKQDQAILKYRQAIARPMTHGTYDRARLFAYDHVLKLLKQRREFDQAEPLYKQLIAEFGPGSCYSVGYTRFLLDVRGNAQAAIDLATRALNQNCNDSDSRELLGVAEYMKWASTTGPTSAEALNQARIYLPVGPRALYLLARSDRTVVGARALVSSGEAIDQEDGDKLTALAYALQNRDAAAARRLLELGARPDAVIGDEAIPVALLPVLTADPEGIRVLRGAGVDYSKIHYRGAGTLEIARQMGDRAVLEALGAQSAAL